MQDIVFYVAANETLGKVRDYSNMRNSAAPLLTLGVAVCLRIRLFEDVEVSTPYPIASFSGITDWKWRMDADFDRSTPCKLVADADGITVHTVTDTINGKIVSFTEVVIPISNMNTRELVAWLGNNKVKTGLVGELVGYDNEGHPAFVLQIEDFSVRNRLAGLNEEDEDDPTPVDQEIVTRPMAEQMIQMAVSASAATKQDKLTSENAGTGISITGAGVISTANVPQSAVTGLSASLNSKQDKLTSENAGTGISVSNNGVISAANIPQSAVTGLDLALDYKQNTLSAGFWTEIDDDWISVERYHMIHGPFSRGTVSMQAGEAYRIYATTSAVTLGVGNIPDNTWGLEGHAEIFVASTGYVVTGSNVVLADPLVPDAVNNCTVRFHDGLAIISVEDHIAGYVVISATGTTAGTLPYAVSTAAQEYVAFDASLNGTTIPLAGAVAEGEKHIVGNGYTETAITGAVDCGTSKFTVANLSLQNVQVTGGMLTLGDAFIPSGSTVALSGGGLAIEKVTGAGSTSVIDLGSSFCYLNGRVAQADGCVFTNGSANNGGAFRLVSGAECTLNNCLVSGNSGGATGGGISIGGGTMTITGTTVTGNTCVNGAGVFVNETLVASSSIISGNLGGTDLRFTAVGAVVSATDCVLGDCSVSSGTLTFSGSNTIEIASGKSANISLTSGAILDLTGNTTATPVAPGGDITFESGGATILYSSGAVSGSYMMDNVALPAGAKLTNTAVVDLNSSFITATGSCSLSGCFLSGGSRAIVCGDNAIVSIVDCEFAGGTASTGSVIAIAQNRTASATLTNCYCHNNYASSGPTVYAESGKITLNNCVFSGNTGGTYVSDATAWGGGVIVINGGTFGATRVSYNGKLEFAGNVTLINVNGSGTVTISGGASINLTTYINPGGTGGITVLTGGCTVNGATVEPGTYTSIVSSGGSAVINQ